MSWKTTPPKPGTDDLGNIITELLGAGIPVSDDVMHYIDSTFLNPTMDEFRKILADPSNCEAETVIELLLFPDPDFQAKLEPLLAAGDYSEADVGSALRHILLKNPEITVTFPDGRGSIPIHPPESTIRQFMARLNITKKINPQLLDTLSRVITDKTEDLRIRVMLRNCRREFSEAGVSFLCTCIEKMYPVSGFFWEACAFLLNFFEYTEPGDTIYHHLMQEKKRILKSIAQVDKNQKAMETNSMELLMLRGVNFLTIDIEAARKKIVLIDHICISIFGKTESFGFPGENTPPVTTTRLTPDDFPS